MSQIEDRNETFIDETTRIKKRIGWHLRIVISVTILAVIAVFSFHLLKPKTYTATAYLVTVSFLLRMHE
jgi:hypothetical protein